MNWLDNVGRFYSGPTEIVCLGECFEIVPKCDVIDCMQCCWFPIPKCSRQSRFSSFLIRFDSRFRTASILQCWRFSIFSIRFCWIYKHLIFVCASRFSNFRSPFDSSQRHLNPVYSSRFSILHHPKIDHYQIYFGRSHVSWDTFEMKVQLVVQVGCIVKFMLFTNLL